MCPKNKRWALGENSQELNGLKHLTFVSFPHLMLKNQQYWLANQNFP